MNKHGLMKEDRGPRNKPKHLGSTDFQKRFSTNVAGTTEFLYIYLKNILKYLLHIILENYSNYSIYLNVKAKIARRKHRGKNL